MKTKLKMAITIMMLGTVICILIGRDISSFNIGRGIITSSYRYLETLIPAADSTVRAWVPIYLWLVLICGILAAILIWVRTNWIPIVCLVVCLVPVIYYIVQTVSLGFSPLEIHGIWDLCMKVLPLISAILCGVLLFRRKETQYE